MTAVYMGLIPQSFIDELLARADIVELIGSRVQLKKAGREYKACCPFHNEKSASFCVSPDKQFYHCFGCGAHGTALRFLMEHDHLSFPEAIEELATRLGLDVPRENGPAPGTRQRMDEPLYDLMARVTQFYVESLSRDPRAQEYVARRGLDKATIERFGIGYAPNSCNEVLKRFGASDDSRRALLELGLIIERERHQPRGSGGADQGHYDRFRDRIMFPIRDTRGRTVAFGGRILDQGEPKYLNSPETALFHKGRELYALYDARRSGSSLKQLLIVEGYMDAVRLHQAGIACAVATLGTATTSEHFKRIFRIVSNVVFAFDGDRAGRAAAWRALQHALPEAREGREIRFLFLPDGHDPDSLVGEEGREAFEKRMAATVPLSEYLIRELSEQSDLTHADGRARFAENARPLWTKLPEGVYSELLLEKIAEVVGISALRLRDIWTEGGATRPAVGAQSVDSRAAARTFQRASGGTRSSGGRGSLMRQAVLTLLQFPSIALEVSDPERARLDECEERGIEVLRELLDNLRSQPAKNSAQVIERWAGKPGADSLEKLLQHEHIVADAVAAAAELHAALAKLADRVASKRFEALMAKSRKARLEPDELQEFQRLMLLQAPRDARGG
jgi:DNA primase